MIKNIAIAGLLVLLGVVVWMNMRTEMTAVSSRDSATQSSAEKNTQAQPTSVEKNIVQTGTTLSMRNTGLTNVSQDIFSRTTLTTLDLSHNQLSGSLPAEVRHLTHLTALDISYNNFTGVPAEIGQLTELTSLNLSHNPITGLPLELGNLTHLEVLNLSGTQYSKADLDQIRKKLPATTLVITE